MYAHEMHAHEMHAHEMHAHEVHAHEVHAHEVHAHEMHANEVHVRKIRAHEVCCAQQTGMHILVVEALLTAIFLSEGRANTYGHRKCDRQIVLPIPSHSPSPA